jgi:hypothetical protein
MRMARSRFRIFRYSRRQFNTHPLIHETVTHTINVSISEKKLWDQSIITISSDGKTIAVWLPHTQPGSIYDANGRSPVSFFDLNGNLISYSEDNFAY